MLGADEASATIEVINLNAPPVLIYEPYDLEAFPGTTIELPCGAEGDPPPLVRTINSNPSINQNFFILLLLKPKWKKDGRTLTKSIKYSFSSAGSIFISNVNEYDAGRYECSVANEFGRVTASCVLTVRYETFTRREIILENCFLFYFKRKFFCKILEIF